MLLATLLGLWAVLFAAPETPVGRLLHRLMVAAPAAFCSCITRGHILLAVAIVVVVASTAWWLEADGLAMLGMATPEITGWIVMFDIATYLDVITAIAFAASMVKFRTARSYIASVIVGRSRPAKPRAARAPRRQRLRPPAANDDADGPAWRLAC